MVSCSIAALGSVLLLRVAHAFVPPGLNTVVVSRPNRRRTAAPREEPRYNQGLSPSPQPDAGGLLSCIDNRGGASPRISVGASSSRGKFLESLLVSSAALVVCTTAADAAGTEAAGSAGDPAPVRRATAAADKEGVTSNSAGRQNKQPEPAAEPESAASSAFSGLVAGAAVSTSKQLLLHPVDTVKTRLQLPQGGKSPELFRGLYDGVVPPLLAGLPSGALFFAAKDAFSTAISNASGGQFADLTTVAAVGLAQFPYWGIRTPAELLKIRSQAGMSSGNGAGLQGAASILADEGVKGLYTGYSSNIAYAFPADAIKFLIYGALKRSAKKAKGGAKLGTIEAAVLGSGASLAAQAVTTPLDVVRTRVMTASAGAEDYEGVVRKLKTIADEEGFSALWAGTTPRVARSVLSGAIQFGSYEFVKGLFGVEPRKL